MIQISRSDIVWNYLGLVLCSGVNLLLLPFALRFLAPAQLGLWYTFSSFQGIAVLLDFGFSTTLGRNFTYAWAGADTLQKQGIREGGGEVNGELFLRLYSLSRILYLLLAAVLFLLLAAAGTGYIRAIAGDVTGGMPAWFLYLCAVTVNLYALRFSPVLKGIGAVKQCQQVQVVTKAVQFLLSMALLLCGAGLVGMAAGYLTSALLSGMLSRGMLRKYDGVREIFQKYRGAAFGHARQRELFADLLPNLWRQGAISAADFLNSRALILLVSGSLGLEASSAFGLLQQVTGLVTTAANALFNAYLPLFGECRLRGDVSRSRRLFLRAVGVQWGILLCGGAGVLLFGNPALSLLGASGRLPATGITFAYLLASFMLNNHLLCGSYVMTGNRIPMCRAYLVSGGAALIVQWLLLSQFGAGLFLAVCAGGCVQLCYNNWRWVFEALKELEIIKVGGRYET